MQVLQKRIILTKKQIDDLISKSRADENETPAILFGGLNSLNNYHRIFNVYLCENVAHSPVYFELGAKQEMKILEYAVEKNLDVAGIFHSHPYSTAYPSSTDFEYMKRHPTVWIIYSCKYKDVKAFERVDGEIKPVKLVIEK